MEIEPNRARNYGEQFPKRHESQKIIFKPAEWHASGFAIVRALKAMQTDLQTFENASCDDVEALKREINFLRRQLTENGGKSRPLSWDTTLLIRKTENLAPTNIISCDDPNWREIIQHIEIGPEGIRVNDLRTVEHIEFVAAFAARRRLSMTYGNRSFHLEPRQTGID